MSQKRRSNDVGGVSERGESRSRAVDCETVLAALEDPDCRALLEATAEEALTAGELIERCGVPRSTTYRKLERLTEAGLLEESIRISPDGKHANEYRRTFDDVTISLDDCGSATVGLSSMGASPGAAD
ncbi:HTH domain protein [Natronomonas moolapensis 8.8.11]|uniref:HTH domain protein n=1 Tax=Natronomonas moolapensis (strain DSM 18674 / CECT 7526 / JCM 14361 / 8.8.11) TaxID=268739 RepID=M1XTY2_NATM8|nr:helix-turn-helix domain-containing protein [Natronomonas moolapensis]CCQ37906.1 HTH domain protein [Natronomonas moolapensis 8.8.11]